MNTVPTEVTRTLLIVLILGIPFCTTIALVCFNSIKSTTRLFVENKISEKEYRTDKLVLSQFTIISIFVLLLILILSFNIF